MNIEINYKFNEDNLLGEIKDYVDETYSQHYGGGKYQATDMILDSGHGEGFAIGNIMKYAMRYGKKGGKNRQDILKVVHYALIALHNHDETINEVNHESK